MPNQILINVTFNETRVALCEDDVISEIYIERQSRPRTVGNIYKGKVGKIVPGMQAAFISIGLQKSGFISADDVSQESFLEFLLNDDEVPDQIKGPTLIQDILREGQDLLVQVIKEPSGGKGAKLSSNLALPGKYVVMLGTVDLVGVSRKIEDPKERKRLTDIINDSKPPDIGFIARTASEDMVESEIVKDMEYLTNLWGEIKTSTEGKPSPSLLYQEPRLYLRALRDLVTSSVSHVLVDSPEALNEIKHYLDTRFNGVETNVELYEDPKPIFEKYGVEAELTKMTDKKVWLKSGGYLIIDIAEALTVVDINTGRYFKGDTQEETIYDINIEAAKEVAHQIRLRNLVGIIVIDFIDMKAHKKRAEVLNTLTGALKNDKARSVILEMSEFGVIQMTRQRIRENLMSIIAEPCHSCGGTGLVKSLETSKYELLRSLKMEVEKQISRKITVKTCKQMIKNLKTEQASINKLSKENGVKIYLAEDSGLDHYDFELILGK